MNRSDGNDWIDHGGPRSVAYLYLPVHGAGVKARHAIEVRPGDAVRCRWPQRDDR